jgi:hypothetical protein
MKFHEAFPSRFIKATDLDRDQVFTISEITSEVVGDGVERRCLAFEETSKTLPLNRCNWIRCSELIEKEDDSQWIGAKIRLVKKRVPFKGDLVDAVRVDSVDQPF